MLTLFFTCVHTLNVIFTLFTWLFPTHPSKLCWKIFPSVKSSRHFQTVTHTVLTLGASPPGCLSTLRSLCFNYSFFPFYFGLLNCELVSSWNLKYFCCGGRGCILDIAWFSGVKRSFPPMCLSHQLSHDSSWLSRYPSLLFANKVKASKGWSMAQWLQVGVIQPGNNPCSTTYLALWSCVTLPLCASVSFSVKWRQLAYLFYSIVMR